MLLLQPVSLLVVGQELGVAAQAQGVEAIVTRCRAERDKPSAIAILSRAQGGASAERSKEGRRDSRMVPSRYLGPTAPGYLQRNPVQSIIQSISNSLRACLKRKTMQQEWHSRAPFVLHQHTRKPRKLALFGERRVARGSIAHECYMGGSGEPTTDPRFQPGSARPYPKTTWPCSRLAE